MKGFLHEPKRLYELLFTRPVDKIETRPMDYDSYWRDKRQGNLGSLSRWQRLRAELALSHIDTTKPVSFLDIGCGDGSILKYLKEHTKVTTMIGVDVSAVALEKAREFGIETVHLDINDPDTWSDIPSADYIILFEVLEHLQDSERLLRLMHQKAKKGVFFSFPNTGFYAHRLRLLLGAFPLQWRVHPGEHLRFWTHGDLRWWLKALQYTQYVLQTYEGVPVLNRLLPSLFGAGLFVFLPKDQSAKV